MNESSSTKAEKIKETFNYITIQMWCDIPEFDIVINATSVGLKNENFVKLNVGGNIPTSNEHRNLLPLSRSPLRKGDEIIIPNNCIRDVPRHTYHSKGDLSRICTTAENDVTENKNWTKVPCVDTSLREDDEVAVLKEDNSYDVSKRNVVASEDVGLVCNNSPVSYTHLTLPTNREL